MRSLALSAAALLLLLGCASATDAGAGRTLGVIAGYNDDDPRITLQAQGRAVTLTVVTYGASCDTAAGTDIELSGQSAVVSPYDIRGRCSDKVLRLFQHTSTFAFAQAGTARVVVRGIEEDPFSGKPFTGDTIAVERTIALE